MEYRVAWYIDVEAETPKEAAEKARQYQRNPEAQVGVFECGTDEDDTVYVVDLDEDSVFKKN